MMSYSKIRILFSGGIKLGSSPTVNRIRHNPYSEFELWGSSHLLRGGIWFLNLFLSTSPWYFSTTSGCNHISWRCTEWMAETDSSFLRSASSSLNSSSTRSTSASEYWVNHMGKSITDKSWNLSPKSSIILSICSVIIKGWNNRKMNFQQLLC